MADDWKPESSECFKIEDEIARVVLRCFDQITCPSKPKQFEWTVLAAIVQELTDPSGVIQRKAICFGTGTKCLGAVQRSADGQVLNDSHGEILARRAFIRYLFNEMGRILNGQLSECLEMNQGKFSVKENVQFQLFVTQPPCGDASIYECDVEEKEDLKQGDGTEPNVKRRRIFRWTGAKSACVSSGMHTKNSIF